MSTKQQILDILHDLPDPDGDETGVTSGLDPLMIKKILEAILAILKIFGVL